MESGGEFEIEAKFYQLINTRKCFLPAVTVDPLLPPRPTSIIPTLGTVVSVLKTMVLLRGTAV